MFDNSSLTELESENLDEVLEVMVKGVENQDEEGGSTQDEVEPPQAEVESPQAEVEPPHTPEKQIGQHTLSTHSSLTLKHSNLHLMPT